MRPTANFFYFCLIMISVLIPTYNQVCVDLVRELSRQMKRDNITGEIIVIDDCSDDKSVISANRQINDIPFARLIELDNRVSISVMRNTLVDNAKYEIFICLDADVTLQKDSFIQDYLEAISDVDVVCGGLMYSKQEGVVSLRYRYGAIAESESEEERRKHPFCNFKTSNYCVRRSVFDNVRFDEEIAQYGYEDLLFGKDLEENGFTIKHIDNAVYHNDTDTDIDFLKKTYCALNNLVYHYDKLLSHSKILQLYASVRRKRLAFIFRISYVLCGELMERHVLSGNAKIWVFQLLKLCYLSHRMAHYSHEEKAVEG